MSESNSWFPNTLAEHHRLAENLLMVDGMDKALQASLSLFCDTILASEGNTDERLRDAVAKSAAKEAGPREKGWNTVGRAKWRFLPDSSGGVGRIVASTSVVKQVFERDGSGWRVFKDSLKKEAHAVA